LLTVHRGNILSTMKQILIVLCLLALVVRATAETSADRQLDNYFANETAAMSNRCLADIKTLDDSKSQRAESRRRFMVLGQTPDGMCVWDIRRAAQIIHFVRDADVAKVELQATGQMGVNALYASLFESSVRRLALSELPKSHAEGPDYLGVLRVTDVPEALEALGDKVSLR
jgi:hypothetical protein